MYVFNNSGIPVVITTITFKLKLQSITTQSIILNFSQSRKQYHLFDVHVKYLTFYQCIHSN